MMGRSGVWKGRQTKGGLRGLGLGVCAYLWILILPSVARTDVLLNKVFQGNADTAQGRRRWSSPLVLCARAKASSVRKKSIHTGGKTEDVSNNSHGQGWSFGAKSH